MSLSGKSHGTGNPAVDQDLTLVVGVNEITLDQVLNPPRPRHAQLDDGDEFPREASVNHDASVSDGAEPPGATAVVEPADEWGEPEDFRSVVRPYTWTRGRTRPVQDLAIETLVSTSDEGRDLTSICSAEHAAIVELCTEIHSVAEVAALLALPLGVARVLLADMIDTGLVHAHRNPLDWDSGSGFSLLERVLDGLYRL